MALASRNFNSKQALEREIKDLYAKIGIGAPSAPTASFNLTADVAITHATIDDAPNGGTVTLQVAAAAANPTNTILAAVTGTAGAMVITVTPNNGTNNPVAAATAVLDLTADVTLTSVALGSARNTNTFTLQVLAAAPNPAATVLVAFTGTAAAIVCTVTPNDGTNNAATPVALTTAELVELINSGVVVGKTITLTDASSLRNDQTAAGGGATPLADAGEGDGVVGTFAGGTNPAVNLTTAEFAELLDSGTVVAKTVTVTDASSLLANIASATGGGATPLADAGEGDGIVATWASGADNITDESIDGCGIASIARNGVGDYTITLSDSFYAFKSFDALVLHATAADHTFQVKSEAVNDSSSKAIRFLCLTGGSVADPASGSKILCKIVLKNSSVPS